MVFYEIPDTILRLIPQSVPPELPPREMVRSKSYSSASHYEQLDNVRLPKLSIVGEKEKFKRWKSLFCGVLIVFALVSFGVYLYIKLIPPSECSSDYAYFELTGYCYKTTLFDVSFETANNSCTSESAQLASIHSAEENEFVNNIYNEKYTEYLKNVDSRLAKYSLWIGLIHTDGSWQWTDGTPVDYLNWAVDAPEKADNRRNRTELITSKWPGFAPTGDEWYHILSTETRAFVCKKPSRTQKLKEQKFATTTTTTSTTATPISIPTERPPKCLSGYTYFLGTQFCYKAYPRKVNFNIAKETCARENSTLVSIHSDAENDFVIKLNRESYNRNENTFAPRHRIWIGLVFSNQTREWSWEDGSDVDYTNWMQNEPNNIDHEHWTSILIEFNQGANPYARLWFNQYYTSEESFVCKQRPL